MRIRRWDVDTPDTALAADLAEACEIHPFLSLLLTTRGLQSPEEILAFLVGQEEGADPFSYADMDKAVERIETALAEKQKILVYGDYDVDGITATVLLYSYLRSRGADAEYQIPRREDGYGLHPEQIAQAAENGVRLIVTVDTGVSLNEEVSLATEAGIDIVVTDHHQPPEVLPSVVAVVDPHRRDCESVYKDCAGVGMAFMLVCALEGDGETVLREYGDLLTLGTLADVIPLRGLTRDLMRRGLSLLNESTRPGLVALRRVAGYDEKELTATATSFSLVPRLNAAGRMGDPMIAAQLLLAESEEEAAPLAAALQELNTQRQSVSTELLSAVTEQIKSDPSRLCDRVLVLSGAGWPTGVLGIVAARLAELYGKPTFLLSEGSDGLAHGSARSISGFSVHEALVACSENLLVYGGHELAAGLTLKAENIDLFRRQINAYAASVCPQMPVVHLSVALRLRPDQINMEKLALMELLEPYGADNAAPLFGLFRMRLDNVTALGGGKHLRLSFSRDCISVSAIKFQTTPEEFMIPCGSTVNCIVSLEKNEYRGTSSVSVRIKDIGYANTDRDALQRDIEIFESIQRRESVPEATEAMPSRELLTRLYSLLHKCGNWRGTLEQLQYAVARVGSTDVEPACPRALQVLVSLELWRQASLIEVEDLGEILSVRLRETTEKADLTATPLWRYLEGGESRVEK